MIRLKDINRSWGNFSLQRINLEIEKGEIFGLFGHNGAGKTLLLETIAGIWIPDEGEIWMEDRLINSLSPEERKIGFVYQEPLLFPHLSVKENILFSLKVRGVCAKERIKRLEDICEELKLERILERKNTSLLSAGERQMVSLARALISSPKLLLLDEPTHSLDEENCRIFYEIIENLNSKSKITIILVSHDYEELTLLAERIAIMENGRIIRVDENSCTTKISNSTDSTH